MTKELPILYFDATCSKQFDWNRAPEDFFQPDPAKKAEKLFSILAPEF